MACSLKGHRLTLAQTAGLGIQEPKKEVDLESTALEALQTGSRLIRRCKQCYKPFMAPGKRFYCSDVCIREGATERVRKHRSKSRSSL